MTFDAHYEQAPLMVVRPGGRVHLQDQARACTSASACAFVRKAYLVPGDVVLASVPLHGYRCVYIVANGRLSAGFVSDMALAPAPVDRAPIGPDFLAGHWRFFDDNLTFRHKGASVSVEGDAIWPGVLYSSDGTPLSQHTGGVSGSVRITGDRFDVGPDQEKIWEGECHVWGWRRGPYLIVTDNEGCGGANVRFMGIYVKDTR